MSEGLFPAWDVSVWVCRCVSMCPGTSVAGLHEKSLSFMDSRIRRESSCWGAWLLSGRQEDAITPGKPAATSLESPLWPGAREYCQDVSGNIFPRPPPFHMEGLQQGHGSGLFSLLPSLHGWEECPLMEGMEPIKLPPGSRYSGLSWARPRQLALLGASNVQYPCARWVSLILG